MPRHPRRILRDAALALLILIATGLGQGINWIGPRGAIRPEVDPGRIAVELAADRVEPEPTDLGNWRPHGLAGWRFLELATPTTDPEDRRELVRGLAARADLRFAAPVFRNDSGEYAHLTRHVLAGFASDAGRDPAGFTLDVRARDLGPRVRRLAADAPDAYALAEALRVATARDAELLWIEPDLVQGIRLDYLPNDPGLPFQWYVDHTGFPGATFDLDLDLAWDTTFGDARVKVMVLDTGVEVPHPDLLVSGGADFTDMPTAAMDGRIGDAAFDLHGTQVASVLSAFPGNGIGIAGMVPACSLVSARIFRPDPTIMNLTMSSWVAAAITWGANEGVRVSNMSFHLFSPSSAVSSALAAARAAGMIHFAAAGNSAVSTVNFPASDVSVNGVSALNPLGQLANFSSWGPGVDFCAPGELIAVLTVGWQPGATIPAAAGTSFASPIAAGTAAMVLARAPWLSPAQVEDILADSATDIGAPGFDNLFGHGIVKPAAALAVLAADPVVTSGGRQVGRTNALFREPVVVRLLDANGSPRAGVALTLTAENGIVAPGATTDALGQAVIDVVAGAPGPVVLHVLEGALEHARVPLFARGLAITVQPGPNSDDVEVDFVNVSAHPFPVPCLFAAAPPAAPVFLTPIGPLGIDPLTAGSGTIVIEDPEGLVAGELLGGYGRPSHRNVYGLPHPNPLAGTTFRFQAVWRDPSTPSSVRFEIPTDLGLSNLVTVTF
ncbi:MAG: S8 family serine peptidase [Planctomycetota bacterium]